MDQVLPMERLTDIGGLLMEVLPIHIIGTLTLMRRLEEKPQAW